MKQYVYTLSDKKIVASKCWDERDSRLFVRIKPNLLIILSADVLVACSNLPLVKSKSVLTTAKRSGQMIKAIIHKTTLYIKHSM